MKLAVIMYPAKATKFESLFKYLTTCAVLRTCPSVSIAFGSREGDSIDFQKDGGFLVMPLSTERACKAFCKSLDSATLRLLQKVLNSHLSQAA